MDKVKFLRGVPFFSELPEADLARLAEIAAEERLAAGQELFAEGSPADRAYIIQQGKLEILKTAGGREILVAVCRPGDLIGEMALLEHAPRSATVRARSESVLLAIHKESFEQLLRSSATATMGMLHTVLQRWRASESLLTQSEKMAQLGTLTAGIIHDLKNPAAAIQRSAGQVHDLARQVNEGFLRLISHDLTPEHLTTLSDLEERAQSSALQPLELDSLTRSDREAEVEDWLSETGVPDAWEHAPSLVDLGFQSDDLDDLARQFDRQQLPDLVAWLSAIFELYTLVEEIRTGSGRISEIVRAMKAHVYQDHGPRTKVNVHDGLEDTLILLRNKLKQGVEVVREYDPELPLILGHGGELNQVWTNLMDNAIDAMEGRGHLLIKTWWEGDWVMVAIEDNGPGIPAELQSRIFDAFFTTKPRGQGTGLGLEITYNIVVFRHGGDIEVASRPGRTRFTVRLPVHTEAEEPPVDPTAGEDSADAGQGSMNPAGS